jgi:hypothetical protein
MKDHADPESLRIANEVSRVAADALNQLATHLGAEAGAIVLLQGGNVAGTVIVPPGLEPAELITWARKLSTELRVLANDVDYGNTRAELERQAKAQRAQQA